MTLRIATAGIAALALFAATAPAVGAFAQEHGGGQNHAEGRNHVGGGHPGGDHPSTGTMVGGGARSGGGGMTGGGNHGGVVYRGGMDRGGGYHGGGYGGDRNRGGGYGPGGFVTGFALGAVLGNYAGHPYYCRHHRHWRWSHHLGRYVYDYSSRGRC